MSASSSRLSTPSGTTQDRHTSHPAHKLLTRAHPDDAEAVTKTFTDKVLNKPLLLSTSADHADNRAARRHIRERKKAYARQHAKPKPLSAKEKRGLGLYKLKPEECKYSIYKGLHQLWRRYILEVLGYLDRDGNVVQAKVGQTASAQGAGALMASADYHGMEIEVVRCVDAGRVGVKGIVVRETRSTFTIVMSEKEDKHGKKGRDGDVTSDTKVHRDKVRMILKKGTVFRVTIDLPSGKEAAAGKIEETDGQAGVDQDAKRQDVERQLVFEMHGDQLEIRPIERAVKKFKWKAKDYL